MTPDPTDKSAASATPPEASAAPTASAPKPQPAAAEPAASPETLSTPVQAAKLANAAPPSQFRQPEYLGDRHHPKHRVRCPIHGFIRYSDAERDIIDGDLFRRLRYIRQLALTELVYPGATHTRFEHSLGVMEMATRIFDRLAMECGTTMHETFREVETLRDDTMAKARLATRLAALLHDTGHCCFSHAAETVIHKDGHESLTVHLLRSEQHLKPVLEGFFPGCAELTANLIKPDRSTDAPQTRILRDIVSGQIDADRTDYLLRDSYHCGVDYGRFDHRRLIECLTVWRDEKSGDLEMAIHRDGIHSFESLILARYQMNTQVYYHRLRRIYDKYLEEYFRAQPAADFNTPEKILAWNDIRAMHEIFQAAVDPSKPGHPWAKRIVERRHHRDVYSLDESDGVRELPKVEKVLQQIRKEYPDIDFIEDLPVKPVSIHKLASDDDQDTQGIDFPLIESGRKRSVGDRSHILKNLPRQFRVGFIFAEVSERAIRQQIASRCRDLRNSQ